MNDAKPDVASLPAKWRNRADHQRIEGDAASKAQAAAYAIAADELDESLEAALAKPASGGGLLATRDAWFAVCDALDQVDPDWMMHGPVGVEAAVATIRRLATAEQPGSSVQGEAVRKDWQKRCLEVGFEYWRAPDSHGVECTHDQAKELLEDLLGVEVEFTTPPPAPAADHIADADKKVAPAAEQGDKSARDRGDEGVEG